MPDFAHKRPVRNTSPVLQTEYRRYLPQLAADFNNRCGYTDSSHAYWGVNFHVDHFAPLKPNVAASKKNAFLDGELRYSNLVYACPQVNWAKSNDWPSDDPNLPIKDDKGYYDPGVEDFNTHFYRTDGGAIMPMADDKIAIYMWKRLKLYLKRYELYWRMDTLRETRRKLSSLAEKAGESTPEQLEVLKLVKEFGDEIESYQHYLDLYKAEVV